MDLGGHGEIGGRAGNHPATGDGDQRIAPSMGVRPTMPQTTNDNPVIDLGVLSAEPAEEYHAKAGEYLSSHHLLDFMACPYSARGLLNIGTERTCIQTTVIRAGCSERIRSHRSS